ncbi:MULTISPECIES: TIGR02281 family clan AA aspartic protease [unclassified Rhizobium]|uniref:TIGR02281 family clan AA aspartic protease n=1 Tax=unclassified Rhizobium TaxID=2613769 RepID=UPI000713F59E|nr:MULTISPECIES: TIGR02281 family clan AA aspartic protease [unclassified Rhizobium]KQS98097.1 aspartic protease [Rhizobium sp. Leaf386]KQT00359.1 aspartic protease [Rhizobium sp. Leaf391]KQT97362.1 aspartic protease [Rhizobium sp. Leaf453]
MNKLTILFTILAVGLVFLILNHDSGRTFGIVNDDFGHLVTLSAIAAMFGAGILQSRRHFGESMRQLGIWVLIILVLVSGYLYRTDLQSFGNRLAGGLIPGRAAVFTDSEGIQEVVLHKVLNGHFEANVAVNGVSVQMLVDTGASRVALSYDDAEKLGLAPETLSYTQSILTANGEARAAPVTLAEVSIGPIVRKDVKAMVTQQGMLDQSLLGMSFLSTLDFLQMQTDELRLRD